MSKPLDFYFGYREHGFGDYRWWFSRNPGDVFSVISEKDLTLLIEVMGRAGIEIRNLDETDPD